MVDDGRQENIWTSEYNRRPEIRGEFDYEGPVKFYDTTLRDGEQTVGVVLHPEDKVKIARQLDELGVDRIEGGFPVVSDEDNEAFRLLNQEDLDAEIWGFSRAVKSDVDELLELGTEASVIEVPTSDLKLDAYGLSRQDCLDRATSAVAHASENGMKVAFFTVDGTRTEIDFLKEIYSATVEAGAEEVVVVDTIGVANPEVIEWMVREVKGAVGNDVPVHFHGQNDFGLATASSVAAVRGGADWIQGTINGMGERAGNADIGEVAMALRCLYDIEVDLNLEKIRETSTVVKEISDYEMAPWKPVVGQNLFTRESGAVAHQFHLPNAIEPYSSKLVGADRGIVLGKKSGLASIKIKADELGLDVPEESRAEVLDKVKQKGIEKDGLLTDEEFREIVQEVV